MSESTDQKPAELAVAASKTQAKLSELDALLMIDAPPIAPSAAPSEPVAPKSEMPAVAKPDDDKPAEAKANEAKVSDAAPVEAKPADTEAASAGPVIEQTAASKRFRESASTQISAARERIAQRNLSGAMTIALAVGVLSAGVAGGGGYLAGLSEKSATHARATELSVLRIEAEMAALRGEMERAARASAASAEATGERLERIEQAQAEPLAKLSKLAELIERVRSAQASMVAATKVEANEVTGAVAPQGSRSRSANVIVAAWVLREFDKDVALIEGKRGLLEIALGDEVPGAGRVEGFRRHEGRWAVVTSRGLITSR